MTNSDISIIGGAYVEECSFPNRQIFRGSGGRAAAFLSSIAASVEFYTTLGKETKPIFENISLLFKYKLKCLRERNEIVFKYDYPLAAPKIYHASQDIFQYDENISCRFALVFGMLEQRPVVNAQKVVYDAQDGSRALPFDSNQSSAEEIALVLSLSEGKALSGENNALDIANKLLNQQNVSAVIIKCGPQGAFVKTSNNDEQWIYPFKSNRVYKIGSGDIFSAAFAFAWMLNNKPPLEAAWFASKCCSIYVENGIDKFSTAVVNDILELASNDNRESTSKKPLAIPNEHIYLAGPFFNTAQRWLVNDVRRAILDMGFRVFSPIHDVGVGTPETVATQDLRALDNAKVVLAILDGLDAGTLFEVGYARAKKIKVIAVAESIIGEALTMVSGSSCEVVDDLTTGIYAACREIMTYAHV